VTILRAKAAGNPAAFVFSKDNQVIGGASE
jgi:hypothetical protein